MSRENRLTDPTQFVDGLSVMLHHVVYGEEPYVIVGKPWYVMSGVKSGWHVNLRHASASKPVEHSLVEIGATEEGNDAMWVDSPGVPGIEEYV